MPGPVFGTVPVGAAVGVALRPATASCSPDGASGGQFVRLGSACERRWGKDVGRRGFGSRRASVTIHRVTEAGLLKALPLAGTDTAQRLPLHHLQEHLHQEQTLSPPPSPPNIRGRGFRLICIWDERAEALSTDLHPGGALD